MQNEKSITEKIPKSLDGKATVKFLTGNCKNDVVQINKDIFFVGRSETNDLVVNDRSVSRKHAVINFNNNKYTISDLNSFKGIVVNGRKANEADLATGDRIKLGNTIVEFSLEGETPQISPRKGLLGLKLAGAVLLAAILALLALKLFKTDSPQPPGGDQIDYYYSMGVKAYNVDKNFEQAAAFWNKVLELDPKQKTAQGRNALILLGNIGATPETTAPAEEQIIENMPYGGERPVE